MNWYEKELKGINLGDERLNKRAIKLLNKLSGQSTESIPKACGGWQETKAAYRFFDNDKVTAEKILAPHIAATTERIKQQATVLLIQDTTELNYSSQKQKKGVGPNHSDHDLCLNLHPIIAVTPEKLCIGLLDDYSWYRTELHRHKKTRREVNSKNLHSPIHTKESYRWLLGYKKSCGVAQNCHDTQIVCVGDRESDIYDIYDACEQDNNIKADWLIRSRINRALLDETEHRHTRLLHDEMALADSVGHITIEIPKQDDKPARQALLSVKIKRLTLHPPTGRRGKLRCSAVKVTAMQLDEINPPNEESAVEWLLLTSVYGETFDDAIKFINWYLCRWQIEIFFKVLKNGCNIEGLQLTEPKRFLPCIALYCIIAWRILFITMVYREDPSASSEYYFSKQECLIVYLMTNQAIPTKPPSLKDMIISVAQLGGYLRRKHDSPPGVKTIWRGLSELNKLILFNERLQKNLSGETYG